MFEYLGFNQEEIDAKFGFFVEALKYGTPPHAGFAFGLDRTVMLMAHTENIRDVIAFPKTNAATDLMCSAPSLAMDEQYDELHIQRKQ
jgi:aspartyl-tRNA synthetase